MWACRDIQIKYFSFKWKFRVLLGRVSCLFILFQFLMRYHRTYKSTNYQKKIHKPTHFCRFWWANPRKFQQHSRRDRLIDIQFLVEFLFFFSSRNISDQYRVDIIVATWKFSVSDAKLLSFSRKLETRLHQKNLLAWHLLALEQVES